MIEIKKHIGEGFANGELYDILLQLQQGLYPISGETYYVSKVGNNTDGLTWETAFTTIAGAITANNTYIAVTANSYGRNRMYIDAGNLWAEDLAIFPNQCDMIGVGARTGWIPTIYGCTTIATAVTGCHIYNIMFHNTTVSSPVVTILSGSHGIEFHKCVFFNGEGNSSTAGLKLGSISDFVVEHCKFTGSPPSAIGILCDGTMAIGLIENNIISAGTTGIQIADGTTADWGNIIRDNIIMESDPATSAQLTTGILISDTNSRCHTYFINNYISAVDAISFAGAGYGNMSTWLCIGNTIVEGAVSTMEAVIVDG